MNFRPRTVAEIADRILEGENPGFAVKDFLHEFHDAGAFTKLVEPPRRLEGAVQDGRRLDAFLQALAVYLAVQLDCDPPDWTRAAISLPKPWFASPGPALRNYLLLSSPAPFRMRNLFIDEDSLKVV
jgi:hypothetical protein